MGAFQWVTSSDPKVIVGAPFRTIVDHGIQAGIHGDGVHIAPLNPWQHIYFATTGVNSFGDRVNGDQQITRQEALRLFTRANSWFLRMEDRIGSIEPGKLADLVVLDRDYFTVPDEQIKQIRSVLTIVGGRIVARRRLTDGHRPAGGVQRRRARHHHHDHGAGAEGPARHRLAALRPLVPVSSATS